MVAEFDPIMKEHIRRAQAREIQYTYLGPKIQNELKHMLADEMRSAIVMKVKHAKYISVILDYTPDASHEDILIRGRFNKLVNGLGLFTELKNVLSNLELDIDNIRGQGYDNGTNISGRHKGVQKDSKTKSEAESLAIYELENFEFLLGMVIWYKLLHTINTVSTFFQAENMDIDEAIKCLQALILFLKKYRETGFSSAMDEAK
ncbi:uncharacterized protein LOC111372440 [Olea europaea var. sylvestris]|uniref:uncharacterized protein LOC111372440 n=1 Tax=Olea europaea var. sylvestris TaxID=158386 RepID=UPI000C1D6B0E|nr:uncharacterized protein LOC111372440 [Olea europaea var. sylvestris]